MALYEEVAFLAKKSQFFTKLISDEKFIFEEIVSLHPLFIKEYQKQIEGINHTNILRYDLCELLLKNNFSKENFQKLQNQRSDDINCKRRVLPSMLVFPLFYFSVKDNVCSYLENLAKKIIGERVDEYEYTYKTFYEYNLPKKNCSIMITHKTHKKYLYFVDINDGNIEYGRVLNIKEDFEDTENDIERDSTITTNVNRILIANIIKDFKMKMDWSSDLEYDMVQNGYKNFVGKVFSFDNFEVNDFNRSAYEQVKNIFQKDSNKYNPVFIYGNNIGKTHLLKAIKYEANKQGIKAFYITVEDFRCEYVSALKNKSYDEFKNNIRQYEIILIDDFEDIFGKESTQNEVLYLIDHCLSNDKQVVIASKYSNESISGLCKKLENRINCGLKISIA